MITKVDRKYLEINSLDEINLSEKPKKDCKVEKKKSTRFSNKQIFL